MIFQWNDWNTEHIARHGVTIGEAEHVASHASPPYPTTAENDKLFVWGQTSAGRYLQVIYVYIGDDEVDFFALSRAARVEFDAGEKVAYVIHAMEMTEDQKRQYRRLKR